MRLIVDAHLDLAMNALSFNRDITRDLQAVREAEAGLDDDPCRGRVMVTLPQMRRAGVAVCIATLIARSGPRPPRKPPLARRDHDYAAPHIAHAMARGQLAYYQLLERLGEIRILRTQRDLDEHWACWSAPRSRGIGHAPMPVGVILGMECADPITHPAELREWWDLGLRNIEPAHYGHGQYAGGTGTTTGLAPLGVELLAAMKPLNVMLDLTHLSDESIDEALDLYTGPILASHSNCRSLVDNQRQLPDHHIRRIVERGGVIGAVLYNGMLRSGWQYGRNPADRIPAETVALHIDHVCQLAGSSHHVGLGSDLDGGFGNEATPQGIDSIADLHTLAEPLDKRGYGSDDLDRIFHSNWLRLFGSALPP
jgi:membrane dipeptidase